MDGITRIYLVTNCYGDPNKVYIGKEKHPKKGKRVHNHKITYGQNIEFTFIDKINSLNHEDWKPIETYWIQQFKAWGFKVLNQNEGGGGPLIHSQKTRDKISEKLIGQKRSIKTCQNISKGRKGQSTAKGHKKNKESKNKTSLSNSLYPVKCLETNNIFRNVDVASREMNISPTSIRNVCNNIKEKTKGYTFRYIK